MADETRLKTSKSVLAYSGAAGQQRGDRAALWKVGVISGTLFASFVSVLLGIVLELEGLPMSVCLTVSFATVSCSFIAIFLMVGDMVHK
jgi:hypothetical protein